MPETLPRVDVVICALDEEEFIDECLDHVLAQTYTGPMNVYFVDSGSTDSTLERVRARATQDARLHIYADGKRRTLPEALNIAAAQGTGEIVSRVDAHGYPARDFIERAVAALDEGGPTVACVGGKFEQFGRTPFGRALAVARESRFGVGGSGYASSEERAVVDTVPWGSYRRAVLEEMGGFAPEMNYSEDEELNWRIRQAGYDVVLDSRIRFSYYGRGSWRDAFRQYRNYGRARVGVVRAHPTFLRPYHAVPAVAVAAYGTLMVGAAASDVARKTLAAVTVGYCGSAALAAVTTRKPAGVSTFRVAQAFSALHVGYGVGMLQGLWTAVVPARRGAA